MHNYNEKTLYIATLSQNYIKNSLVVQDRLEKYLENLQLINKNTGELHKLRSDFQGTSRDNYLWLVFQSIYMQNKMIDQNKTAIFITLTLPPRYHPFHNKSGQKNKEFNSLSNGAELLQTAFRDIYDNFRVNRKRVKLHYQRVIEPHKTFVPHLHALIYVDTDKVVLFKKHIINQISAHQLGAQYDIEVIKDIKRSATYLLKYIKKNLSGEDLATSHMISGWKRDNKIRIYTYTQMSIPKFIFQKLSRVLKLEVNVGENVLEKMEALVNITINYKQQDHIHQKVFKPLMAKYRATIDIDITKKTILKDENINKVISEARILKSFATIQTANFYFAPDFFRFVHSVEDIENDLIYFDPLEFDYQVYFSTWSQMELIDLFEDYSRGFETKDIKIYTIKEFIIEDDSKTYYKKSDFELR